MSEKITARHLARKAILYVRQSSAYQVSHNLESQKLQYAMQDRLRQLGWQEIEVVDDDLGRSAAGTMPRAGFERMVAEVCLGHVGAVAAREVSRFARNSREWQQLVEVCRVVDTVLIDQEMVYAPRQSNDRLLLGLKGSMNEYELDLLRQRSVEARREKARRGELLVACPVGYVKGEGRLEKDPDRRVQEAIRSVFNKFLELGTARQTLMWFLEHGLQLPARGVGEELCWKRPSYATIHRILTNPNYGGAYAYGKSEHRIEYADGQPHKGHRRKPREQWLALIPLAHDGYVSWEQFERIQGTIAENVRGPEQTGAANAGRALLAGLLRCRRCGHKLTVRYTGSGHDVLRYSCWRGFLDNGEPRCIAFGGVPVDERIGREILRVVQPAAIEAAIMASEDEALKRDEVVAALERDLEAARYSARRAHKQFDAADPENRLVTDELERRWNRALEQVRTLELKVEEHAHRQAEAPVPTREGFEDLAADLEAIWNDDHTDPRLKKRIVRTLIREIVVDVDAHAGEVILTIHWKGGVHTELRLPRRRRGQNNTHTAKAILDGVRMLARLCSDDVIAGVLNRNGLLTGRGNRWTRERVTALRSHHGIACYSAEQSISEGWMNLTKAANLLGISARTLRLAVESGKVQAQHPFADGPWVFNRSELATPAARALVQRVSDRSGNPALPIAGQANFEFSST